MASAGLVAGTDQDPEARRGRAYLGELLLGPGLADASIVVLADRYATLDLLTLDERHFRAVRGLGNRPFRLLPADR
jgi:predicted nucleic acid-binding protein